MLDILRGKPAMDGFREPVQVAHRKARLRLLCGPFLRAEANVGFVFAHKPVRRAHQGIFHGVFRRAELPGGNQCVVLPFRDPHIPQFFIGNAAVAAGEQQEVQAEQERKERRPGENKASHGFLGPPIRNVRPRGRLC